MATAAANGSNRIARRCPQPTTTDQLTCVNDLYRPSCHSFASRGHRLSRAWASVAKLKPYLNGSGPYITVAVFRFVSALPLCVMRC